MTNMAAFPPKLNQLDRKTTKTQHKQLLRWCLPGWHQPSPWKFLSCPLTSCRPPWESGHPGYSCYRWPNRERCQSVCTGPHFQTTTGWTRTVWCAHHTWTCLQQEKQSTRPWILGYEAATGETLHVHTEKATHQFSLLSITVFVCCQVG